MSHSFIKFNDERIDPFKKELLNDLVKLLLNDSEYEIVFGKHGYIDPVNKVLFTPFKWRHRKDEFRLLKGEVVIQAMQYNTEQPGIFEDVIKLIQNEELQFPKLFFQIYLAMETYRSVSLCQKHYSNGQDLLNIYINHVKNDAKKRIIALQNSGRIVDQHIAFVIWYLFKDTDEMTSSHINIESSVEFDIDRIVLSLKNVKHLNSEDSFNYTYALYHVISKEVNKDGWEEFFHRPKTFEYINQLQKNQSKEISDSDDSNDVSDKTKIKQEARKQDEAYLEMEVDSENSINANDANRSGDSTDDMTEVTLGRGQQTKDESTSIELDTNEHDKNSINKNAILIEEKIDSDIKAQLEYDQALNNVKSSINELATVMNKLLDKKHSDKRTHLSKGKLGKDLIPLVTKESIHVFDKRDQPSREIDATFTLLIDASYSMENKLEYVKDCVILFVEVLKRLNIKHEVYSFYEDTFESDDKQQPNYMHQFIDYNESLYSKPNASIMNIKAHDDNRDGYIIRKTVEKMKYRTEKNKFILLFSDGEPSAFDYADDGIVDTYYAVNEANEERIQIINLFIDDGPIEESIQQTIQNIYKHNAIFIDNLDNLSDYVYSTLKKLLIYSI